MLQFTAFFALLVAWLIPNHYPPWSSVYNEAAACCCVFLLIADRLHDFQKLRIAKPACVILFLPTIPFLQWVSGQLSYSGDVWVASLYLFMFGLAVSAGQLLATQKGGSGRLALTVVIGAASSAIILILQVLDFRGLGIWFLEAPPGFRPFANLMQPNNASTLLGLGLVSVLLLREIGWLSASPAVIVAVLLGLAQVATQSRTGLLYGPLIVASVFAMRRRGIAFRTRTSIILLLAALQWLLALEWSHIQQLLMLGPAESLAARGLETPRTRMWLILLNGLSKSPWIGYGWLQVGADELSVVNDYPPIGELWLHAHNLFLDLIIWCGYPIGLALSALIVYWFASSFVLMKQPDAACAWMSVAILGVHSMLELPHHYLYFLVVVGLWIGFIEAGRQCIATNTKLNWLPLGASLGISAVIITAYPSVEEAFREVRFEAQGIENPEAPRSDVHAPLMSSLTAFLEFVRTEPHRGMTADELGRMRNSVRRYPYAASLARLGTALALNGQEGEARIYFIAIQHIYDQQTYEDVRRRLRLEIAGEQTSVLAAFDRSLPN